MEISIVIISQTVGIHSRYTYSFFYYFFFDVGWIWQYELQFFTHWKILPISYIFIWHNFSPPGSLSLSLSDVRPILYVKNSLSYGGLSLNSLLKVINNQILWYAFAKTPKSLPSISLRTPNFSSVGDWAAFMHMRKNRNLFMISLNNE